MPKKEIKEKIIEILKSPTIGYENEMVADKILELFAQEEKEELLERIWNLLIESLPPEAENLHTASQIGEQSSAVLKNFMEKLEKEIKEKL